MTIRKRDNSVKDGCGIDGSKGQRFTKEYADSPWSPPEMERINPKGAGKYTNDDSGLRNRRPYEATADSYDVFDEVEGQSSDSGNRAVKSRGQP
jgi:hypothetical protein